MRAICDLGVHGIKVLHHRISTVFAKPRFLSQQQVGPTEPRPFLTSNANPPLPVRVNASLLMRNQSLGTSNFMDFHPYWDSAGPPNCFETQTSPHSEPIRGQAMGTVHEET